jgi:hypothetical protein
MNFKIEPQPSSSRIMVDEQIESLKRANEASLLKIAQLEDRLAASQSQSPMGYKIAN